MSSHGQHRLFSLPLPCMSSPIMTRCLGRSESEQVLTASLLCSAMSRPLVLPQSQRPSSSLSFLLLKRPASPWSAAAPRLMSCRLPPFFPSLDPLVSLLLPMHSLPRLFPLSPEPPLLARLSPPVVSELLTIDLRLLSSIIDCNEFLTIC